MDDFNQTYRGQDRGGAAAYESYFAGMNASMRQKVALTTAHFPSRGTIADMGSGSGQGTFDLACLHDHLTVIGVDINPTSVELARNTYRRPNLTYERGDISDRVFPVESLDGILNSSVFHHVTSFNGFDIAQVHRTLDNQVAQLRGGGVLIVRDFVIPDGPDIVELEVPLDDGDPIGPVTSLSTAALFDRFAAGFKCSTHPRGGISFDEVPPSRPNRRRLRLTLRLAAEFLLRKDYRDDWDVELLEEYTYFSRSDFEAAFQERGLRVVVSAPLWNPWIVRHRFENKAWLYDLEARPVPHIPTNYLIVGEKRSRSESVGFSVRESETEGTTFLKQRFFQSRSTAKVYEMVERPRATVDVLPWFVADDRLFLLAKKDFPRPIVTRHPAADRLDTASLSGFITEPLSAIVPDAEDLSVSVERVLAERAGITPGQIRGIGKSRLYFTSPGGINERVRAVAVEIDPTFGERAVPPYSAFVSAGSVRELDALQVLRAGQVGGLFDARLEINIYQILRDLGRSFGPWIGDTPSLVSQSMPDGFVPASAINTGDAAAFEEIDNARAADFLTVRSARFAEVDREGRPLAEMVLEYVKPRRYGLNTILALPVLRLEDEVYVGLERRDFPAVQFFQGRSGLSVCPAWRARPGFRDRFGVPGFLTDCLATDFGVRVTACWELGGAYFPSPGVTPEVVFPYLFELDARDATTSKLDFFRLTDLLDRSGEILDAHTAVALFRCVHALTGE